jgi:DNA gyrase subunit A
MAPHNLTEVCNGIIAYIDNHDITIPELMEYIKAPDFPTGATIYGYDGVREAFETGRGRVVMRGEANIEEVNGKTQIIITELPYMVNQSDLIDRVGDLMKEGRIEGISNVEKLSNRRNGVRLIFELKREAVANVVLNKLYQYTALQSSFSVNNVALVNNRPMTLNLKDMIVHYVKHRHEVVIRRTQFDLRKAEERAHILEGLLKALDIIDEIIALIRASATVEDARNGLMEKWGFSDLQARAIVEMRLRQLTGLDRQRLQDEFDELMKKIEYFKQLLENESMRMQVIKDEIAEVREKYGDTRKTRIEYSASDFRIEDTIADAEVVITISHLGYIKRTLLSEYKVQNRGGKGSKGSSSRDEDFIEHLYTATNHNYLLFFTEKGKCFWMRVYEIPEGTKTSKGRAIQNLLNIEGDDKIKAVINIKDLTDAEYINNNYIILCTEKGIIKKTSVEAYSRPRVNGINAITIREGDHLLEAKLTNGTSEILMALHSGKALRFNEKTVRPMGRNASGVKGITLANDNDFVAGMICVDSAEYDILVVSENGYGKRSPLYDYRITNRGGKGVKTINITDKTGGLIALKNVTDTDDLMIINRSGLAIRLHVDQLRVMGRATQGVRLINVKSGDVIAAVTQVPREDDEEETENQSVEIIENDFTSEIDDSLSNDVSTPEVEEQTSQQTDNE